VTAWDPREHGLELELEPVAVAIVSSDERLTERVRDALALGGIGVVDSSTHPRNLPGRASDADALAIAGEASATRQRVLLRAAALRFPALPCIIIASLSATGVRKALDAGAAGIVLDSDIELALPETVRAVRAGQIVIPRRRGRAVRPPLTHREKETLALVARGLTNRQIASALFLTESTVKSHLASIFAKLGVSSRSEATALVLDPDENLGLGVVARTPVSGP
jgi:DNA-binding NarL/FixJ family response regulator